MTTMVEKIAQQVKALPKKELDEFLSWLADYELELSEEWDNEIEQDSRKGGRLNSVLERVRSDIAAGRTKALDKIVHDS